MRIKRATRPRQPDFAKVGVGSAAEKPVYKAFVMQDKAEVGQKLSDAELITLVSTAQEQIEAHKGLKGPNLLLLDFARELLKKRLRTMKLIRP
jgi:hypothetical protein